MTNDSFKKLLTACFVGEQPARSKAIEDLFAELRPLLRITLVGLSPGDWDLADDALQSAFLKYLQLLNTRKSGTGLGLGYFVTIARHCLVDEIRHRKRHVNLDELLFDPETGFEHDQTSEVDLADREDLVLLALQKISPRCRFILERYYIAGVQTPLLARDIGISPQSVSVTVKRCREEVKQIVSVWLSSTKRSGTP